MGVRLKAGSRPNRAMKVKDEMTKMASRILVRMPIPVALELLHWTIV